jgi:hypothetical protein
MNWENNVILDDDEISSMLNGYDIFYPLVSMCLKMNIWLKSVIYWALISGKFTFYWIDIWVESNAKTKTGMTEGSKFI